MTAAASGLARRLGDILGADGVLTEAADCAPFLVDHLGRCRGRALAVALPRTVSEVSRLLALCETERIGVVPQAGNTSYCGGGIPDDSGRQLVLSLQRLNRIRALDAGNYSLKDISREAARQAERELIFKMLQQTRWNRKETAEILGISYKALLYKIKENGLDKAS